MKSAILDLGTNTFHLLIVEINSGSVPKILFKTKKVVKLGVNGINEGNINPESFQRGIDAIIELKKHIISNEVVSVYGFATSAIRSASNGQEFIAAIKKQTQIDIEIISGDKEAELIYQGVSQAVNLTESNVLIMDIGGGSVEFIIANQKEILWKQSFDIGAARLKETFHTSEPIEQIEQEKLKTDLKKKLTPLIKSVNKFNPTVLIGASGTFDTFVKILFYQGIVKNIIDNQTEFEIDIAKLKLLHYKLLKSNLKQRLKIKGMAAFRADMIVVASILTQFVIDEFDFKELKVSGYALKEGAISQLRSN
ncbi:MAG: exopolyphosphatase [Bacteroidetes bacterium]|nr:exopolyphosphatase [Bacteroidia bacterium]PCH67981.1 MAG: exopolyphosphatase [Bacteroidota bacterium]